MKKSFVLDTNVLLHDPGALFSFEDNDVIIPIQVVEEVDHFKRQVSELGRNARAVSKTLDRLRARGRLSDGVRLEHGGVLRVSVDQAERLPAGLGDSVDNRLLGLALDLKQRAVAQPVIVVSKDTNLRIKADALGITAQDYETDRVLVDAAYTGQVRVPASDALLAALGSGQVAPLPDGEFLPHQYVHVRGHNGRGSVLARVNADTTLLGPLQLRNGDLGGVRARNKEQYFALDALVDDSISLVTLMGRAGTGKTFLAVAAGLHQVLEGRYQRLLISRPIVPVGRDVGYLPGDVESKLSPWMQPINDNLGVILERLEESGVGRSLDALVAEGLLSIEPVAFIRGRSINRQYMIIDEAQNLTPLEAKTIVTRVGEGTKIVLTGDIEQIDNPYVDAASNGFIHIVDRFMKSDLAAHVAFRKGERSRLAEFAAERL